MGIKFHDINKTWNGTYSYSYKRLPQEKLNKVVCFIISIDSFDGQIFEGIVEDDILQGGTPGKGKIKGQIYGNNIEFIKKMPIQTSYLIQKKERIVNPSKKHPTIYYKGIINDNFETAEGIWKIRFHILIIKGGIAIGFPQNGKWTFKFK